MNLKNARFFQILKALKRAVKKRPKNGYRPLVIKKEKVGWDGEIVIVGIERYPHNVGAPT